MKVDRIARNEHIANSAVRSLWTGGGRTAVQVPVHAELHAVLLQHISIWAGGMSPIERRVVQSNDRLERCVALPQRFLETTDFAVQDLLVAGRPIDAPRHGRALRAADIEPLADERVVV